MKNAGANIFVSHIVAAVSAIALSSTASEVRAQQCTPTGTNQTCSNSTLITGDQAGIDDQATVTITNNTSTIQATGTTTPLGPFVGAIRAVGDVILTNNDLLGAIQATGDGGAGIAANGTVTVTKNLGSISGTAFGIRAGTVNIVGNFDVIEARAADGQAIRADTGHNIINNFANGLINGGTNGTTGGAGIIILPTATLELTNEGTISGTTVGVQGSGTVTNSGKISGLESVNFSGINVINKLILQTGSELIGLAQGSVGATSNDLILQGHGTASNNFANFDTLDVQADSGGTWVMNGISIVGAATVASGTLVVGDADHSRANLVGDVTVKSDAVLAGLGTVTGNVTVAPNGIVHPGAATPFSTLNVNGNVSFQDGSIYRVSINPAGQSDKLALVNGGIATLTGGTVNALAQNGTYAPSTQYTILSAAGGFGGTAFKGVNTNLLFLTPTLTTVGNDVILTMALNGTGGGTGGGGTGGGGTGGGGTTSSGSVFGTAAQTSNQVGVAGALDAGVLGATPVTNPLLLALLNQTNVAGARQAFDALSGEAIGSVHSAQTGQVHFTRDTMLGRMRQASYYSDAPDGLGALSFGGPDLAYASSGADAGANALAAGPGKAPARAAGPSRDLTFWAQGLGGWGHADSDGNAASVRSRFGGFLSGADVRLGETWRAGLVAGYMRTDLNVDDRSSSAGIDSAQFGGYAGGKVGAFNVRGGASYSYDSIDTSRSIFFPGFTDKANAHFHGNVGQVFGEVGYGIALSSIAIEPLAGLAFVHVRDGSFAEAGGLAALSVSSANESTGYSTLGLRAATAVPLANGTVLIPRASLQWQYAFGDVTPVTALAFQSTGTSFTVAGIPIARNTALIEGGFDWRFSPQAKLGAYYQGELATHAESHALKGAFTWDF